MSSSQGFAIESMIGCSDYAIAHVKSISISIHMKGLVELGYRYLGMSAEA
jgi:hypothetical protein